MENPNRYLWPVPYQAYRRWASHTPAQAYRRRASASLRQKSAFLLETEFGS
jgi:hypothetical protein